MRTRETSSIAGSIWTRSGADSLHAVLAKGRSEGLLIYNTRVISPRELLPVSRTRTLCSEAMRHGNAAHVQDRECPRASFATHASLLVNAFVLVIMRSGLGPDDPMAHNLKW